MTESQRKRKPSLNHYILPLASGTAAARSGQRQVEGGDDIAGFPYERIPADPGLSSLTFRSSSRSFWM